MRNEEAIGAIMEEELRTLANLTAQDGVSVYIVAVATDGLEARSYSVFRADTSPQIREVLANTLALEAKAAAEWAEKIDGQ